MTSCDVSSSLKSRSELGVCAFVFKREVWNVASDAIEVSRFSALWKRFSVKVRHRHAWCGLPSASTGGISISSAEFLDMIEFKVPFFSRISSWLKFTP